MKNIKDFKQFINESYDSDKLTKEFEKVRATIKSIDSHKQIETAHKMLELYKRNCDNYIEHSDLEDIEEFEKDFKEGIKILNNMLKEKEHKYEIN